MNVILGSLSRVGKGGREGGGLEKRFSGCQAEGEVTVRACEKERERRRSRKQKKRQRKRETRTLILRFEGQASQQKSFFASLSSSPPPASSPVKCEKAMLIEEIFKAVLWAEEQC